VSSKKYIKKETDLLNILITGANRGLGKKLAQKILQEVQNVRQIALTSRDIKDLDFNDDRILKLPLDLSANHLEFYGSPFYAGIQKSQPFTHIIHCASPYQTTAMTEACHSELTICGAVMANQVLLLPALLEKIVPGGTLLVCGSVSGEPVISYEMRSDNFCLLHCLQKSGLRDLITRLYCAMPDNRIIHANMSGFVDSVPEDEGDNILALDFVVQKLLELVFSSEVLTSCNVDIVAGSVAKKLRQMRTGVMQSE
jgi:hypothetical protein